MSSPDESTATANGVPAGAELPARVIRERYVVLAVALLYVVTGYPDVGGRVNMGDSAKFQLLSRELGIGHAPGNPLYLMLSALWVRLPLPLSDATKVTLLSSVFGIVTLTLVVQTVQVLELRPIVTRPIVVPASSLVVVLLGLGPLFWTLSTEAEVYTLGSVFVAGTGLGVASWTVRRSRRGLLLAIASLVLGLSNHLTIAALGPALVFVLLRDEDGRAALRKPAPWVVGVAAALLAASAYGWIAWRASKPLTYSELPGPLDLAKLIDFVTARSVRNSTWIKASFASAILDRLPELMTGIQKQWGWPLLLLLPFGALRLFRSCRPFALFVLVGVIGHFAVAFFFRIPDPEGVFVSVAVLLAIPLALVPEALRELPETVLERERTLAAMVLVHGVFVAAHLSRFFTTPFAAYVQKTREGQVVLNLPTLVDVVPENAMVAVPCGHYGCVEVTSYYRLVDPQLRAKGISFVRFSWSEWDDALATVPLVDAKERAARPLCVLLAYDRTKLAELGLRTRAIARPAATVRGRSYISGPLHCLDP